ncbi:hypothetical protein KBD45_00430 [Candidatus Dojkabacteria bacterium]|nr:hypothetical protein [Candidatus Dojkabacteria bacterium]
MTRKNNILKIAILLTFILLVATLLVSTKRNTNNYNHLFEDKSIDSCINLLDCDLAPGDILIKRQITDRTNFISKLYGLYFTHAAMYVGDDNIVEARGKEKNKSEEIWLTNINNTEWVSNEIESFIVLRVKNSTYSKLKTSIEFIKQIANDDSYVFGFDNDISQSKEQYCTGLIWKAYNFADILGDPPNKFISPDSIVDMALKGDSFVISLKKERV